MHTSNTENTKPGNDEWKNSADSKYSCPMHPEIVRDRPGICPECGMSLVTMGAGETGHAHGERGGPDKHAGHKTSSFLVKFWFAFALTIPAFFYSEMAKMFFGITAPEFSGSRYVLLALGSIIFFGPGRIFLTSAYREIRARLPGMMTLIAIAITTAYLYSFFSILLGGARDLVFELSSLIAIMLLGHWIEMRSVQGAQGALRELAKLLPDQAELIRGERTETISLSDLREGDVVLVRPGAKVPADGEVVDGRSDLNESIITGESKPVAKEVGSEVIAGSLNGDGSLKIRIKKIGEHTFLAGVMRLVADAQASKSRLQLLSDRAALYLTYIALSVGAFTFIAWMIADAGIVVAIERLVAVLVIACPHALGLAVPLVAALSTTMAARNGFLVRERRALEEARQIDTVLFDKTGTLTKGEFGVSAIMPSEGVDPLRVLALAASVNAGSEHPLAHAMVSDVRMKNLKLFPVSDFMRIPGKGTQGVCEGALVQVGNVDLLTDASITLSDALHVETDARAREGKTVIFVISDKKLVGAIALADIIREESRAAITMLKELGVKTAMITGDSPEVAVWVAGELGIDDYFAQVKPGEKSAKIKLLQSGGKKVAMVGDGVNDAPALTQADIGIAIGAGTNVAIESAGIVLVRNDPRDIPKILRLSRLTYTKMIQNLFWATGYNVVAIPLAAGVLAHRGIILEPAFAAVLMSVSTVIVALNALLLRRNML